METTMQHASISRRWWLIGGGILVLIAAFAGGYFLRAGEVADLEQRAASASSQASQMEANLSADKRALTQQLEARERDHLQLKVLSALRGADLEVIRLNYGHATERLAVARDHARTLLERMPAGEERTRVEPLVARIEVAMAEAQAAQAETRASIESIIDEWPEPR